MAGTSLKFDNTDVEAGGGGVQPQPALYNGKVVSATVRKTKADGSPANDIEVVVSCGEEYAHSWMYIGLGESSRWKQREFTDALGLPPKHEFKVDSKGNISGVKDKPVLIKIVADTDLDGDYRGKVKNLFKPGSLDDVEVSGSNGAVNEDDLSDWSDDDLKAEIAEKEIEISGRFSREKAIAAIREYNGPGASEPDGDSDDGPAADAPEIPDALVPDLFDNAEAYASWPDDDIKGYVDDLVAEGVEVPIEGRYGKQKAIAALVKLGQAYHGTGDAGEPDAEPDADAEPSDEYDSWSDTDLEDEIAARNEQGAEISVSGRKSREKMIDALRKDDKPF